MSDKTYTIDEIKIIVMPIAKKYGVDKVCLFGSYARGEAGATSDLDFVIDKGRLHGLKLAGMLGDLQEVFGKNVDLLTSACFTDRLGSSSFKKNIEEDMVTIYEQ